MEDKPSPLSFFQDKRKVYLLIATLLILLTGSFFWWRFFIYPYESTDNANIEGVVVDVGSEVGGRIVRILKDEGSLVKAGDLLFVVDDTLLQRQKEKIEAAVQHAKDVALVQQIRVDLAERDLERALVEFSERVISDEMRDHIQKTYEAEKAQLQSIYSEVAVQESALKMVKAQIEKTLIFAPLDGVIAKKWHFPGDIVQEGQTVFSLFNLQEIWIVANLEETKVACIHQNDPVFISIDAYPDLEFKGSVQVIGAGAASQFSLIPSNNASGNFTKVTQRIPLKISLQPPYAGQALYLRPGMSAEVKIKIR